VGHQQRTLLDAIEAVRVGGAVYLFGVPDEDYYSLPINRIFRKQLRLQAGTCADHRGFLAAAQDFVLDHPEIPETLVTHVFDYREAQAAFKQALTPSVGQLKIVLTDTGKEK
jgi:threonine dehydrogenase-like Zn-dependent dehydrogenase